MRVLIISLWLLIALVFAGPSLARSLRAACRRLRSEGWAAVALAAIALAAATLYGGSKAGTNEPPVIPPAAAVRIRLYYETASGKLVPLDAKMREVQP